MTNSFQYFDLALRIDHSRHPEWRRLVYYCLEVVAFPSMELRLMKEEVLGAGYDAVIKEELPQSPRGLIRRKFLIALVEDGVSHRVYAFREKVFQLLNAALLVNCDERDTRLRDKVRKWLSDQNLSGIKAILDEWECDAGVKWFVERRPGLVHSLSKHEWLTLAPEHRVAEWFSWDAEANELGNREPVDIVLTTWAEVDRYRLNLRERLETLEDTFGKFESRLTEAVLDALSCRDLLLPELAGGDNRLREEGEVP